MGTRPPSRNIRQLTVSYNRPFNATCGWRLKASKPYSPPLPFSGPYAFTSTNNTSRASYAANYGKTTSHYTMLAPYAR